MLAQGKRLLSESDDPTLTDSEEGRVQFMQYNFFHPQPLRDVSAFFIRQCTHNWCDRDVVAILRGFVPGLEGSAPGTPLLINDTSMLGPLSTWLFPLFLLHLVEFPDMLTQTKIVLPVPGTIPLPDERSLRQLDLLMMICLGAKQRTLAEFEGLLKEADPRYKLKAVHAQGTMGLMEVHLEQ